MRRGDMAANGMVGRALCPQAGDAGMGRVSMNRRFLRGHTAYEFWRWRKTQLVWGKFAPGASSPRTAAYPPMASRPSWRAGCGSKCLLGQLRPAQGDGGRYRAHLDHARFGELLLSKAIMVWPRRRWM